MKKALMLALTLTVLSVAARMVCAQSTTPILDDNGGVPTIPIDLN